MSGLPPRNANTMSDAIALSSPSGRMSKRARKAAEKLLDKALFGDGCGNLKGHAPKVLESVRLRRTAQELRELAARGMCPRKYPQKAAKLEQQAAELEAKGE